jgi:hypothetical protein
MFNATIRRLSITTPAVLAAILAFAQGAEAQSRASEAAVVRVEVVSAPAAPELRAVDAGWSPNDTGAAAWTASVAVDRDAVLSLHVAEREGGARASFTVHRDGDRQLADVELVADATGATGARELPVTLRIER